MALTITNNYNMNGDTTNVLIYYAGYVISSVISLISAYFLRGKKYSNPVIKNLPVYFYFSSVSLITIFALFNTTDIYNILVILASICIVVSIFFNLEPVFFDSVLIFTLFCISPKVYSVFHTSGVLNTAIFIIIMCILSLFKWNATKKDLEYKATQTQYTKNLEKEITLASYVQNSFLKQEELNIEDWTIATFSEPMAGVSGDMFDVYHTEKKLDGLGVFDVSGHGIASGLVTMLVKNIINQEFYSGQNEQIQKVLQNINDRIIEEKGEIENYLTGTLIRVRDNKIEFINAGNPQPLIYIKETNNVFFHENNDSGQYGVIGMADFPVNYAVNTIEMNSGDAILFYTDGITENTNKAGYPYGRKNLMQIFKENTYKTCKDQLNDIVDNYKAFKGDTPSSDDITLVMLKRL